MACAATPGSGSSQLAENITLVWTLKKSMQGGKALTSFTHSLQPGYWV